MSVRPRRLGRKSKPRTPLVSLLALAEVRRAEPGVADVRVQPERVEGSRRQGREMEVRALGIEPGRQLHADARGDGRPGPRLVRDLVESVESEISRGDAPVGVSSGPRHPANGGSRLEPPQRTIEEREPRSVVVQAALSKRVRPVGGAGEGAEGDGPCVLHRPAAARARGPRETAPDRGAAPAGEERAGRRSRRLPRTDALRRDAVAPCDLGEPGRARCRRASGVSPPSTSAPKISGAESREAVEVLGDRGYVS